MSEFIDIINKAHTPSSAAFGIAGEFPVDWRLTVDSLTVLGQLCDNGWVYDGLFTFVNGVFYVVEKLESPSVWNHAGNIKNYQSVYFTDEDCETPVTNNTPDGTTVYTPKTYWYKAYEVEISGVELATEANKLSHKVIINGHESYLSDDDSTIEIGRLYPEEIDWDDIETTTACGMFYGTHDGDKFALLVEKMGNDQYKRTLSIYNGTNSTVQTAYGTASSGNPLTWLSQSSSIGTINSLLSTLSVITLTDCSMGTSSEKWFYSSYGLSITASPGTRKIVTADGREFTTTDTGAFIHPFVIKLHDNGTANILSLIADNTHAGQVRLSDSINDLISDANSGIAATPKAIALLNERIGDGVAAGLNGLEIGGRNLLSLNNFESGGNTSVNNTNHTVTIGTNNTDTYFKVKAASKITAGEVYTISCDASGVESGVSIIFGVTGQNSNLQLKIDRNGRCKGTGIALQSYNAGNNVVFDDYSRTLGSSSIVLSNFKLEKGKIPTDWTPAPEDVDSAIATVQSNLTTHAAVTGNGSTKGHVTLSDSASSTSGVNGGIAATPNAVKTAYDRGTAGVNAASTVQTNLTAHAAVTGNSTTNGHVKLSDSVSSTSGVNGGIAATPNAVKTAYDKGVSVQTNLTTHAAVTGNSTTQGHVKLSDSVSSTSGVNGGIAATPNAVKTAYDKGVSVQTNLTTHAAVTGDSTTKGHVKLSDSISNQGASDNVALTPKAIVGLESVKMINILLKVDEGVIDSGNTYYKTLLGTATVTAVKVGTPTGATDKYIFIRLNNSAPYRVFTTLNYETNENQDTVYNMSYLDTIGGMLANGMSETQFNNASITALAGSKVKTTESLSNVCYVKINGNPKHYIVSILILG